MPPQRLADWLFALVVWLTLAAIIVVLPVGEIRSRAMLDEAQFHLPTVFHFLIGGGAQDYPSATTPGYHWLMAQWMGLAGPDLDRLRMASAVLTAGMALVLAKLWRSAGLDHGWLFAVPAMASVYVFPAGVWVLPDNLAWLTCFLIVLLCRPQAHMTWPGWSWTACMGCLCALAVWVRQANVWVLIVPLAMLFTCGPVRDRWMEGVLRAALICAPASLVLGWFLWVWGGGLTPPSFQQRHQGLNFSAPVWLLVYLLVANVWLLPLLWQMRRSEQGQQFRCWSRWVWGCALCAAAVSLIPHTDFLPGLRAGGLWEVVRRFPVVEHRSPIVTGLAFGGGALAGVLLTPMTVAGRLRWCACLLGVASCLALNRYTFDRYVFGFAVMLLPLALREWPRRAVRVSPTAVHRLFFLVFVVATALVTVKTSFR